VRLFDVVNCDTRAILFYDEDNIAEKYTNSQVYLDKA
jgi:hypothetical protein